MVLSLVAVWFLFAGKDYPEGVVTPADPVPIQWANAPEYRPYLELWKDRWEYEAVIKKALNAP